MKAHGSYFRRKNSKQGLALSTAMAICIVLAILVAVLVSMASLNITTTQATISQREAYVQAKSALAFAESYYSQHSDQIPGSGSTYGEALIVFNGRTVSEGAKMYITKNSIDGDYLIDVQQYKDDALDTYVEVTNTASVIDLTAYCKYGDNNAYSLSREFRVGNNTVSDFTGNVNYEATSDIRYLRFHVRVTDLYNVSTPVEGSTEAVTKPRLYAWYTEVSSQNGEERGNSSIVNKMSGDTKFATVDNANGTWHDAGPQGDTAMTYEGGGWFMNEVQVNASSNVHFVNAIVTKDGAHRTRSGGGYYNDQQSWEFFGIPVPAESGADAAIDVYITLNQNKLQDATYNGMDEFTKFFQDGSKGNFDVNQFAKFCGSYYTVYTKKDTYTIHYRKAGVYDESAGGSWLDGFSYEGYGWWRKTTNGDGTISVAGNSFDYSQGAEIDWENGRAVAWEGFVVEDGSSSAIFGSEGEANLWLTNHGDSLAGEYLTVNVKSNMQPVDAEVPTKIYYQTKWSEDEDDPAPTPTTGGSGDPDPVGASTTGDDLVFQELATNEFALIGDKFNDWGRINGAGDHYYEKLNLSKYTLKQNGMSTYEIELDNCEGVYEFKIIRVLSHSGTLESYGGWNSGNCWGANHGANIVTNDIPAGGKLKVVFYSDTGTYEVSYPSGTGYTPTNYPYSIIGWENKWGTEKDGTSYGVADYAALNPMTNNGGGKYTYTSGLIESGNTYDFKVVWKQSSSGSVDMEYSYGAVEGSENYGENGNFVIKPPELSGQPTTYYAEINFDEETKTISAILHQVIGTQFYLVGGFNNWASDGSNDKIYSKATSDIYKMEWDSSDGNKHVYKLKLPGPQEAGSYEIKVISSSSLVSGADPNAAGSIDFEQSWGYYGDSSGVTMGSDKPAYTYDVSERSTVVITFTYLSDEVNKSVITNVECTPYQERQSHPKIVGFLNRQVKNDDSSRKTNFTSPWDSLYVTYYVDGEGILECKEVTLANAGHEENAWPEIPDDATWIYYSNKDSSQKGTSGYQYTERIDKTHFAGTNTFVFPVSSSTTSDGVEWKVGYSDLHDDTNPLSYDHYQPPLNFTSGNGTMVWTGSSQVNYYSAPIVKVLNMLVSGDPEGGGTKYAFAAYKYQNFKVDGVGTLNFTDASVSYQGEKYYYVSIGSNGASKYGKKNSILIIQESDTSKTKMKGGVLYENEMALTSGYNGVALNMDNRGGGMFISDVHDNYFYSDVESPFNYGGYVPNWYTYKIPVKSELIIEKIEGVVKNSSGSSITVFNNSSNTAFTPAADQNYPYNYPIYIATEQYDFVNPQDHQGDPKYYTYDVKTGTVDTDESNNVRLYFANEDGWSKPYAYCYNPMGSFENLEFHEDSTDSDNHYWYVEFPDGKYCYFVFYDKDGSAVDGTNASKKTVPLTLTGKEDATTHKYDILARSGSSKSFEGYVHPKTQAMFAYQSLSSIATIAKLPASYSYDVATGKFTATSYYEMAGISTKASDAETYYKSSSSWNSATSAANNSLANSVKNFINTLQRVRIYISDDVPEVDPSSSDHNYTNSGSEYFFKEGLYKDSVLTYEERWVIRLKSVYAEALTVFSNTSSQNETTLDTYTTRLNDLIAHPLLDIDPESDAVQIIVDDQAVFDDSGAKVGGGWGQSNIHLYNYEDGSWVKIGRDLYTTTQKSFYAFAFNLNAASPKYMIAQDTPSGSEFTELKPGRRYFFHTATGKFEEDKSVKTYTISDNAIGEGTETNSYGQFTARDTDRACILRFLYDTTVTYGGGSYTIYAGTYTISNATYPRFGMDIAGSKGINLFSDGAKDFFTKPARYGMSEATSYSSWSSNVPDSGENVDIMFDSISISGTASASTSSNKSIGFRYKNELGNDILKLNQNVSLTGGVVNIAVNEINFNGKSFAVNAKTIHFMTDTAVPLSDNDYETITHGTYVLKDEYEEQFDNGEIIPNLATTGGTDDWRDYYTLISESSSNLRGGSYIAKH